jgi:glycosyltransferase involved in cell wall biosynthesis
LLGAASSVHLQRWAVALHQRGRRVSVVTQHAERALPLPEGVALHVLPWAGGAGYLLNAWPLRRLLRRLRPDLLHVHYASGYGSLARLARWRPMLLSVWGSDVYAFPAASPLHAAWLRGNLRAAQGIASTSEAMAQQVRRVWPGAGRIAITPFGVDTDRFSPALRPVDKPDALVIGTVKALAPVYGIDLLVRAFAQVSQGSPVALRLRLVGGGPQRAELEALAWQLGVAQQVEFIGPVRHDEVPAQLREFDVYAAPSRQESFGVAVVEAMACGLPVVVSDAGGLPDVVQHEVNGLVVPVGDVAALAQALQRLIEGPVLRQRLANAARDHAVAQYHWPACVDRMLACQDQIMAPTRRHQGTAR